MATKKKKKPSDGASGKKPKKGGALGFLGLGKSRKDTSVPGETHVPKKNAGGGKKQPEAKQAPASKPSEALSTVLNESVPSAALDLIRMNGPFVYPAGARDGCSCYVLLRLDVKYIGGLNKHMKHDPDKGQFIELVNAGSIEIYTSEEDLAQGVFYFIPSRKTADSMNDFMFLTELDKYQVTLCHVDQGGDMELEPLDGAFVDFKWICDVVAGRTAITEAVRKVHETPESEMPDIATEREDDDEAGGLTIPGGSENEEFNDSFARQMAGEPEDDFQPFDEPDPEPAPKPAQRQAAPRAQRQPAQAEPPRQPQAQPVQPGPGDEYQDVPEDDAGMYGQDPVPEDDAGGYGEDMVQCPHCMEWVERGETCRLCGAPLDPDYDDGTETEYADEEVEKACERLFHAGGLDLEITAEPFDLQFMQKNPFVPISEKRGDGWLDGYVTQMVKNANAELLNLHRRNLFKARTQFLALMTDACGRIAEDISLDNPANEYHQARQILLDQTSKRRADIEEEVSRKRSDMQDAWNEELRQYMESSAQAARRTWLAKHEAEHEAALRGVEVRLLDNIEIEYQRDLTALNDRRRIEAKRQMDLHTAETLNELGSKYNEMLAEEDAAREAVLKGIQEYIDTHRKDEVARMAVLAEGQRQKEASEKTAEAYEGRIRAICAEHDAVCDKYLQEISAARTHEESVRRDCNDKLKDAQRRERELQRQYDALRDRYESLDAAKDAEYKGRITQLENDKAAAEEHLAHVDTVHNKYNKVSLVVWGAIVAAALCIGLLIGAMFLGRPAVSNPGNWSIELTPGRPSASQGVQEPQESASAAPSDMIPEASQGVPESAPAASVEPSAAPTPEPVPEPTAAPTEPAQPDARPSSSGGFGLTLPTGGN